MAHLQQAGADTTSTTLSHLWYLLLRNPTCLERLRKEVDEVFAQGDEPDFAKQVSMPYLNACLLSVVPSASLIEAYG